MRRFNGEQPGVYVHRKTGGTYLLLTDKAKLESEGKDGKPMAVYQNAETGEVWIRSKDEFHSREKGLSRFLPVHPNVFIV